MKQFTIIYCLLSLFIPNIGTAVHERDPCKVHDSCPDWQTNCQGVSCTREKHLNTTDMQQDILASLYGIPKDTIDEKIKYDYNYYGESCNLRNPNNRNKCVYIGGHAGWDVRTRYYEDPTLRKHEFHCITPGIVLANGRSKDGTLPECENNNRTIVIYDEINGYAIHYLHASDVNLSLQVGKFIGFGKYLGLQGNCGLSQAEHIHIEVRTLNPHNRCIPYENLTEDLIKQLVLSSGGTKHTASPTIDPIPYLYDTVKTHDFEYNHIRACTLPEIWGRCKMMHQSY